MTDIYDYYLYDFSKIYLREGQLAPKGAAIHKGPQDGRFYYSDGRSRDHTHNTQYISNRDIEVLEMVRSGTLNLENIGTYAILMLEKLGLVTEDEDGEIILTDEGEQIKSPGMAVLSRVDREEALLKNPLKSRKMVVDDQLLKELDGIKNYNPDNPFDGVRPQGKRRELMTRFVLLERGAVRPQGKRRELFEGLGLIHPMKGSSVGLTEIGESVLKMNVGDVVSIPLPGDVTIRVPENNHNQSNNLNALEESMVDWYKRRGYESINRAILSGDVSDELVNNAICCLDNVLERHKIVNPQTVYSGVGSRVSNMLLSMDKGDTFQIDTYLSTSLRRSTALLFSKSASVPVNGFYKKVVLKINTPMNTTGYYYGDTEEYDGEDEILFPRATQYILKGKEEREDIIIITCDRIDKSTKNIQIDNSRVYLRRGQKAPHGATIHAGSRKRTARYYKTEEIRSKETYGRNVGHIYVAPEDLEALNKIQFFDPSLEEIKQKYFKDFPDTPDEIVMDFKDDYLERGPDLTDDEFDRLNRMTNVGLTYWDGRKYCITADGVEIRKPGVNLIKRYRREELIAQNAKTYGFISDKPEYPVDITRGEDHSQMPMSEGERSALTGYKGSLYKEINPALLGSGNLKMNLHRIANLDALLSRSVISSPTVTYNGTSSRIGEMLMSMAPGDMFQIDTYLSTSLSSGTAAGFSSDFYGSLGKKTSQVLLEISLPAGAHGFYFGENDNVDHPEGDQFGGPEKEILLPRASQFRIDAIERDEVGSTGYRDQYVVKATLIPPPKRDTTVQADNSKVYLKPDEKPPKGVRLHKGTRKATARWYESQEYKKNLNKGEKLSKLVLSAARRLQGKYTKFGSFERKNLQSLIQKIQGTYSIKEFIGALNKEFYVENSIYSLASYGEGDALKNLLPGMVSKVQADEPLYAPLQYRSSTYGDVVALTKIKTGDAFLSKKWLPLSKDKSEAVDASMNIYGGELQKIVFKVDASTEMEGISCDDLQVGKIDQPFEVTDIQDEEGVRIISVKPITEHQYGEKSPMPLGLPSTYYQGRAQELQASNGLNKAIKSIENNSSNVYDDEKVDPSAIFGEYKGEHYILSDKIRKVQQHQAFQAFNGNWFGDEALQGVDVIKQVCDTSEPLKDVTIYLPFDAIQVFGNPQTEDQNIYVRDRVAILDQAQVGSTIKIRQNMVGSINPDIADAKSTYKYVIDREAHYGKITYRYRPTGDPELDKGVISSEGTVLLQRNINWRVTGIHEIGNDEISHKVIDIEPVRGEDNPHYPKGEVQTTIIRPKEMDPGDEGGSYGSYSPTLVKKYDDMGINTTEFSGSHHPDYGEDSLEGQAMASWCSQDYEDIGTYIRTGKDAGKKLLFPTVPGTVKFTPETIIPYLDRYIETFPPLPKGILLYRGVGAKTAARMIKNLKVGDTCIDPCYMSFTDNPEVAWKFAKKSDATCDDDPKVFFRLVSKGGEHAALGNFNESEIVFGRNQKLRVINISKANFDSLPADKGGNMQVYPTPVIVYDVEIVEGDALTSDPNISGVKKTGHAP